ncbi:MAG: hypothetical protein K9J13_13890 [Saprospiraceae bacterium]|nr:hypothetical protein [Saprospiraceae bacterium]
MKTKTQVIEIFKNLNPIKMVAVENFQLDVISTSPNFPAITENANIFYFGKVTVQRERTVICCSDYAKTMSYQFGSAETSEQTDDLIINNIEIFDDEAAMQFIGYKITISDYLV